MKRNSKPKGDGLQQGRKAIDQLDKELVRLLAERMKAVQGIADAKRDNPEAPLRDDTRERELFEVWSREAVGRDLSGYFAGRVLREILNWSRREQERQLRPKNEESSKGAVRVGYQGVPACYSDLAITKLFSTRDQKGLARQGFRSFGAAIDALEAGEIDYALLPIENTIAGSINDVYDLLARRNVTIVGEEIIDVEHCLVALPGTKLEDVRVVRSHPVALQQCREFLDNMVGTVAESYHDTAGAARSIAVEKAVDVAAIASQESAEHYGLQVLARKVHDQRENMTRFLLIAREPEAFDKRWPSKSSLVISVNHRQGALLACLQAFASQGVNLTKLESRPLAETPWEYLFYLDIEGRIDDPAVATALDELRVHTNRLKVLGSYPRCVLEGASVQVSPPKAPAKKNGKLEIGVSMPKIPASPKKNGALRLAGSRDDKSRTRVRIGGVEIGTSEFVVISGPCAIESRAQVLEAAAMVKACGARIMRGGAFKPRSSPYSFQGLGFEGLDMLREAGRAYEMPIVTEVLRIEDAGRIAEKADMLQVGARNMQNFALLRELGRLDRPILLKRGMSATIEEVLMAAEYIMDAGNNQVVLCERGIRTFETATRATLDVSAIPVLKSRSHLPVIVDPSHAAGVRDLVIPLALAATAAGADGLIVESHPHPEEALCDKDQALTRSDLEELMHALRPIVAAQGRTL